MRTIRLAADPLWQCLCPAWTASSRTTPRVPALKRPAQRRQFSRKPTLRDTNHAEDVPVLPVKNPQIQKIDPTLWSKLDIQPLYQLLHDRASKGKIGLCQAIAKHLVEHHGEEPNTCIYNALILSNSHAEYGSAFHVYKLLAEMEREGLELDIATCQSVLRVLAIHPDHLLRADIQNYLRQKWLSLEYAGLLDVVVGNLREGCFEMALDNMDDLRRRALKLPPWLLDMAAYMLSDAGELDAAYQIMRERWNNGEEHDEDNRGEHGISKALWHCLLDRASAKLHPPLTEFVWRTKVEPGLIHASSGMCNNIMSTAARAGDPALATQVIGYMTKRGDKITPLHFQLLVNAYMNGPTPDLDRALSVLTVMSLEKLPATRYHTRSIYEYLKDSPSLLQGAFETLRQLKNEGKDVPVAALNVVIECYCAQGDLTGALDVYKQIHTFSNQRRQLVDVGTFEPILKACRYAEASSTEIAEFVVAEMQATNVNLDMLTYDRLILVFVKAAVAASEDNDIELSRWHLGRAIHYFDECRQAGLVPRYGTIVDFLATQLALRGDTRCWDVFQYTVDIGLPDWQARHANAKTKLEKCWRQTLDRSLVHESDEIVQESIERAAVF